jgi:hypothetical protein
MLLPYIGANSRKDNRKMSQNLEEIVALSRQQVQLERLIADSETALKDLREQLRKVQEEDLPSALAELGLKQIRLDSGEEVNIKEDFVVGIAEVNKESAFSWLEQKGFGALIKTEVKVQFGKGELAKAQALLVALGKKKLNVGLSRNVHWQTLKAFVVEQTRAARAIPLELFGAHPTTKAVITQPKRKG